MSMSDQEKITVLRQKWQQLAQESGDERRRKHTEKCYRLSRGLNKATPKALARFVETCLCTPEDIRVEGSIATSQANALWDNLFEKGCRRRQVPDFKRDLAAVEGIGVTLALLATPSLRISPALKSLRVSEKRRKAASHYANELRRTLQNIGDCRRLLRDEKVYRRVR